MYFSFWTLSDEMGKEVGHGIRRIPKPSSSQWLSLPPAAIGRGGDLSVYAGTMQEIPANCQQE